MVDGFHFQWQQEIELRRQQLEEEMQYSRMMEARKRREEEARLKLLEKTQDETEKMLNDESEEPGQRRGLRRRKPVNYTEKDEDISDLIDDTSAKIARPPLRLPFHSDISDDSDVDESRRIPATQSPATGEGLAVSSTMVNPAKGTLKLKIKRQSMHSSSPPYPVSGMSQHASPSYQSPSMLSPRHPSPLSVPVSTSPASTHHAKSKSSSGSDKESKHRKNSGSNGGKIRGASLSNAGLLESWDFEDTFDRPHGSIPSQLYSPGGESSGSDSNPHRKALKLKLKLTPNHTPE